MRHQGARRDSKTFDVVDEDCGIPTSLIENYRAYQDNGPLAQSDPRTLLLSMSEYDKAQNYNLYDYAPATRPEQAQHYSAFAAHQTYASNYVNTQSQVPSGLPQSATTTFNPITPSQQYGPHDPIYYPGQNVPYPGYVDTSPRQLPEISSYIPNGGQQGTKVTVYFRSIYDFDLPQVAPVIMFGQKPCESWLAKTAKGQGFEYALSAHAPPFSPSSTPSPQVPLSLTFENSAIAWQSPSLPIGSFTYLSPPPPPLYSVETPQTAQPKKRKLSIQASPRHSPSKKPSLQQLSGPVSAVPIATPVSPFRKPSMSDSFSQNRRFSGPDYQQSYGPSVHRAQSQQFYGSVQTTPSLQPSQSPAWSYLQSASSAQSPSVASLSAGGKASLLPSPANVNNPPLMRTSTLQHSPTTTCPPPIVTQSFNPYTAYPANTKAVLNLEGNLEAMASKWTTEEWEAKRRLVQFRRSQQGSAIKATFEPVTLEDRIPNSICVSCIWWEEKGECYVTSVDTIQLLESLVAVRFTVEEKNRIRRNLEGFRPSTVSKTKADSEQFFKIIMGFPNPKPRNIEKDVKAFPWRILARALTKIISKYSASYSSTAGALHTPSAAGPSYGRNSDASIEQQRPAASPHSTSSSATATSHSHAYATNMTNAYATNQATSAGLGIGLSAPPDLRLTVRSAPVTSMDQTTSWHTPSATYSNDLSAAGRGGSWDFNSGYMSASPASGLPASAQPYNNYAQRVPPLTGQHQMPTEARFVPLHGYDDPNQQTSNV